MDVRRAVRPLAGARPRAGFDEAARERVGRFAAREREVEVFDFVATVPTTLVEARDKNWSFRALRQGLRALGERQSALFGPDVSDYRSFAGV